MNVHDKTKTANKKTAGIILAAGSASRMGKTKQLLKFRQTTILGQVVQNARNSMLDEIIVVLGHNAAKIARTIDFAGTKLVRNTEYLKGQSTSIIKGLEKVPLICDAAIFLLGDQPLINAAIINKLIDTFKACDKPIVIPYYKGKRGNPVIIGRSLFHRLKSLSGDTGPRVFFKEFEKSILKLSVPDQAILIDIDTVDDYEKLNHGTFTL